MKKDLLISIYDQAIARTKKRIAELNFEGKKLRHYYSVNKKTLNDEEKLTINEKLSYYDSKIAHMRDEIERYEILRDEVQNNELER